MNASPRLILASASPRRRELLAHLGVPFDVQPSQADESVPDMVDDPAAFARDLALAKARHVAGQRPDVVVIGADTIVVLDGRILGKPHGNSEARAMLVDLRGRSHQVTTGLAIVRNQDVWVDHVTTDVFMRDYTDEEIRAYIASGEPFDKAGSYAIQDRQFDPVERFEGCYCNVVGLPLVTAWSMLGRAGVHQSRCLPANLPPQCRDCPLRSTLASADQCDSTSAPPSTGLG
jgi:septum formation protein